MSEPSVDVSRLAPAGPIAMLDRAFGLARECSIAQLGRAWAAGGLLAAVVIGVYYVERVEGIASLRPLLAVAVVLAWGGRAVLLGSVAADLSAALFATPSIDGDARAQPTPVDVFRTSVVAGVGLWVWAWLLVLGSLGGAFGVVLVVPFFALRGASAPSWLARASVEPQAGFSSFVRSLADTRGRRFAAVGLELAVLTGSIGLALNLYALTAAALLLLRSFMGLEVATVSAFLSPSNTFVQLVIAACALVLVEPLRAAVSAVSFVDAQVRADGLDLRASVERAVSSKGRRGGTSVRTAARAAAILIAISLSVFAPKALAQDRASGDSAVQAELDSILARSEFREFEDHRGDGLTDLVERLLDWVMQRDNPLSGAQAPRISSIPLPGAGVFLAIGLLLVVAVGVYLFVTRRRETEEVSRALAAAGQSTDLRERPPETFLDEAAQLAAAGKLREATRALYLATLIALDRRRLISFEPHRTNWQYLRDMPRTPARTAFREFTRVFDHKWYGQEPTSESDYRTCRTLASHIVEETPAEPDA